MIPIFGRKVKKGILIDFQVTNDDIAGFCGISTRNSVNRILRGLHEENVITMVNQKIVVLDKDYLKQFNTNLTVIKTDKGFLVEKDKEDEESIVEKNGVSLGKGVVSIKVSKPKKSEENQVKVEVSISPLKENQIIKSDSPMAARSEETSNEIVSIDKISIEAIYEFIL